VNITTPLVSPEEKVAEIPRAVPCGDHSFDDALECRCGASWSSHQQLRKACPLNARGRNRGEEAVRPRASHGHT
jgi:hypothetical protein